MSELLKEFRRHADDPSTPSDPFTSHDMAAIAANIEHDVKAAQSPLHRTEHDLTGWVTFLILPLFALSNAGIGLRDLDVGSSVRDPITMAALSQHMSAVADALKVEYETIAASGYVLQIDGPDLAMERHRQFAGRPLAEFLEFVDLTIAAINRSVASVPRDRIRLHVCWGNYEGPHNFDVPLEELLPHLYQARVGALVVPMANPRHAHEYRSLLKHPFPRDWLLVPGVIDTTTNYVEHPQVVADRIELIASAIGDPQRVIAGTDCGFDTSTGVGMVAEEVVWEKLRALREGADLASARLF